MLTSRGVPLIVVNGYEHRFVNTSNDGKRDIYRCCKRSCRGRLHVDKSTNESRIVSDHAHAPINEKEQKRRIALHQAGVRYAFNCPAKRFQPLLNEKDLDEILTNFQIPTTSLDKNFMDPINRNGKVIKNEVTEEGLISNTDLITNMSDQQIALPQPIVQLKRIETFSASHRLHNPELSDEENISIFGKCNNPNGHGHNYTWEAVLKGPIDPKTGMVYNLADLKTEMAVVLDLVDHKNLDKDVAYFKDNQIVSTTENLTFFLYNELKNRLKSPELLFEVTVKETDKNIFTFNGLIA